MILNVKGTLPMSRVFFVRDLCVWNGAKIGKTLRQVMPFGLLGIMRRSNLYPLRPRLHSVSGLLPRRVRWDNNGANSTPINAIKCQENVKHDLSKVPYIPCYPGF